VGVLFTGKVVGVRDDGVDRRADSPSLFVAFECRPRKWLLLRLPPGGAELFLPEPSIASMVT